LLIRGELSDIISTDIAEKMQRTAPRLQRVDVPGVGHAPMLTERQAVDAIDKFLRTVP
jgi:pimeloyl-ACP methyl ester carboxylesterase